MSIVGSPAFFLAAAAIGCICLVIHEARLARQDAWWIQGTRDAESLLLEAVPVALDAPDDDRLIDEFRREIRAAAYLVERIDACDFALIDTIGDVADLASYNADDWEWVS